MHMIGPRMTGLFQKQSIWQLKLLGRGLLRQLHVELSVDGFGMASLRQRRYAFNGARTTLITS
jgi:hypothetical protein